MSPRTRSIVFSVIRIGVSAALLTWILTQVGVDRLIATARTADLRLYGLAFGLTLLGLVVRAWRWSVLLRAVGGRIRFLRLVYLYFVGAFFNAFLPTGFGGDVVRVLEAGPGASTQQAAGTVVVDRLTGFITLFVFALIALPFGAGLLPGELTAFITLMAAGVLGASALLFEGRLLRRLTARLPRALSLASEGWLARTYDVITTCGRGALLRALGIALVFNLILLTGAWLTAQALGLEVTYATLFLFVPIASATLILPISISGLGVREGVYIALFSQVGIGEASATAFSLAFFGLDLIAGLVGGAVYLAAGLMGLRGRTV